MKTYCLVFRYVRTGTVQLALGALIQQYMADEVLSPTALADTGLLHQLPPPLWTTGIVVRTDNTIPAVNNGGVCALNYFVIQK